MNRALERAVKAAGGRRQLAEAIGVSRQNIYKWRKVPAEQVMKVEKVTGVPRSELRPDIYPLAREINSRAKATMVESDRVRETRSG